MAAPGVLIMMQAVIASSWRLGLAATVALLSARPGAAAEPDPVAPDRARLVTSLRALAAEAFERFVVTDPQRRVFGMAYEFQDPRTGDRIQDFGLDAMHDGAWLMSALVSAHRADPEGGHLARAQRYQVPFYVNLLRNSDRLFPHMKPRENQETFDRPIKGWAPRGWDDGPGIDLVARQPFATGVVSHPDGTVIERAEDGAFLHAYFTSSHHLYQDLADALLNVWLSTRDPAVAEAIGLIHRGRVDHGRVVPVVATAAELVSTSDPVKLAPAPSPFAPKQAMQPLLQGLTEGRSIAAAHYDDGLAWRWGEECARAGMAGCPPDSGFVVNTCGRLASQFAATRDYYRDTPYRPGCTIGPGALRFENGGLATRGTADRMLYARGQQYAWLAAALRPAVGGVAREAWQPLFEAFEDLSGDPGLPRSRDALAAELDRQVAGSIGFWLQVRERLGHLPRGCFLDGRSTSWTRMAELGAYAHLIKTIAYQIMITDGGSEWEIIADRRPSAPLRHTPLPDSVLAAQGLR